MAMFSDSSAAAGKIPVICPSCKREMQFNQDDNFYRCPGCKGEYWPADHTINCPGCGRPMRYIAPGFHKCTSCSSEFWPPDSEDAEEEEENHKTIDAMSLRLIYAGECRRGVKHGKSSSGRKYGKKKVSAKLVGERYLLV